MIPFGPAASEPSSVPTGFPPVFIACGARSGSTLLRWLLEVHPDIACPSETDVAVLLERYLHTAAALAVPAPLVHARAVVDGLMEGYLSRTAKSRWCDKSLSNALDLATLVSAWPEAQFLLLHRHCMDVVMSGLDAQPWGLLDYGFNEFARRIPGDAITALATYWIDRETKMLRFAEEWPSRCLSLRYEDLVTRTDEVMAAVWEFLGVEPVGDVARSAFARPHDAVGPADYKVWYTKGVCAGSIGNGARVPPDMVRGPVRRAVNEILAQLGYEDMVDAGWGSGGLAHLDGALAIQGAPKAAGKAETDRTIDLRIVDGSRLLWRRTLDLTHAERPCSIAADPRECPTTTTTTTTTTTAATTTTTTTTSVVAIERSVLNELCTGTLTMGAALRARTVRHYGLALRDFASELAIFDGLSRFVSTHRDLFTNVMTEALG